jgi:hypothetical protein
VLLRLSGGTEKLTQLVTDVQSVAGLPQASMAPTVSVKALPAVSADGVDRVKELRLPAPTVRLVVPVLPLLLSVAVKVAPWASKSVMFAALAPLAMPLAKVTAEPEEQLLPPDG